MVGKLNAIILDVNIVGVTAILCHKKKSQSLWVQSSTALIESYQSNKISRQTIVLQWYFQKLKT